MLDHWREKFNILSAKNKIHFVLASQPISSIGFAGSRLLFRPRTSVLCEFSLNSSKAYFTAKESISEYVIWFSRENGINPDGFSLKPRETVSVKNWTG